MNCTLVVTAYSFVSFFFPKDFQCMAVAIARATSDGTQSQLEWSGKPHSCGTDKLRIDDMGT